MKRLLNVTFKVGLLLLGLLGATAVALVVVLSRPHLRVPSDWIEKASSRFAPSWFHLSFQDLNLALESRSFWQKKILFTSQDLCVRLDEPAVSNCMKRVTVDLDVELAWTGLKSYHFKNVAIQGAQLDANLSKPAPHKKEEPSKPFHADELGGYLQWIWEHFDQVEVALDQARIQTESSYLAHANLKKQNDVIQLQGWAREQNRPLADGKLRLRRTAGAKGLGMELEAQYLMSPQRAVKLVAEVSSSDWQRFRFFTSLRDLKSPRPASLTLRGEFAENQLKADLSALVRNLGLPGDRLRMEHCPLELNTKDQRFKLDCVSHNLVYEFKPPRESWRNLRSPVVLYQDLSVDLKRVTDAQKNRWLSFKTRLESSLRPNLVKGLIAATGCYNLESEGEMALSNLKNETLEASLAIDKLEALVRELADSPYAIPAPLNALKGPIRLTATSHRDPEKDIKIPFKLTTDLTSPEQILKTSTQGQLIVSARSQKLDWVDVDVLIHDLLFTLPQLSVTGPPQLLPDQRVHKERPKKAGERGFDRYSLRVHTAHPNAVRVASNLTGRPIPVAVNVALGGRDGLGGRVQLGQTPLRVLKRDADLNYLNVTADPVTKRQLVDGKVIVTYADYRITIQMTGTTDEPRLMFDSQPPLDQQQIISVLVFGKKLDELGDEHRDSVSSMNSAVTEAALSLGSMYLLASTPIEQVSYNPGSNKVAAKVRLQENLSLNVAKGSDVSSVGLRRRIGSNWAINTTMSELEETASKTVKVFLEWFKRY